MADILDYCQDLEITDFKPGQVILPEGERLGRLYILIEGQIEVIRERTQVTHIDEPGSFFGEMSVLLDMPHSATVKALSDVRAYQIPDALTFLDQRPEFALHIATMLARRLYYTTSYLVDLQQQAAGKRQDLDLVDQILARLVEPQSDNNK
ncbi:cyclic nucleotide-binding domain-containing protein [Devosia rhodophyticola]|uniref:Cyclic nucleotide-binding domain-containing protein n=1 Tax=Devosia rhodophyticola TaxID=3026423 RepID=A0ABY7Z0J7_9HYPH|nr:cyclic nucleotide-binding domain-containing protein [Devosia rhodophyticola]WDR07109.1 cyclic nucleotide-binding domain-containing protein [Devosia rhodophyticola]